MANKSVMRTLLIVVILAMAVRVTGPGPAGRAQTLDAIPTPEECLVEPRTLSFIDAAIAAAGDASPSADNAPSATGTPADGGPTDKNEVETAVTATIVEYIACFNAGDWARITALWADRFLLAGDASYLRELRDRIAAGPVPRPLEQRIGIRRIVRIGGGGPQAGAFVEVSTQRESEKTALLVLSLTWERGRYRIQNGFGASLADDSAAVDATPEATPVPD